MDSIFFFFFSSRRRHTRWPRDWSSDVCSSDLRERAVLEANGSEQPAEPVAVDDERSVAGDRIVPGRVRLGPVRRRLGSLEVGHVEPGPLPVLLIPPDVFFPLRPRLALGVCGGAVVEDAAVGGPHPAPLGRDVVLLGPGLAAGSLVHAVGVDAGVDPTPARSRAVFLEVEEAANRLAGLHLVAADLLEDALYVRLLASPGGSTDLSCHCSMRWVWVKEPSFSATRAHGKKKTSVAHSSGLTPSSFQTPAVSIS